MVRPKLNKIEADISKISIYLRSTKKFGKTTLWRDLIMEKFHDPTKGLLIACGSEQGYTMLDNLNAVHVTNYDELMELIDWLIDKKGVEHDIRMVAFDSVDELVLITDAETIRIHNKDNPTKKVKSIKAAMSGYSAGEKYSANNLIKPMMNKLKDAGFGRMYIAHTKFKTVKTKGSTDPDGYMILTSNLGADYESAFGDCSDVVLTGTVDKPIVEKTVGDDTKKFISGDTVRKLYFRENELIDAGGRFAAGTVPEYMVFDKPNMAADFIRVIEEGMEKSKTVSVTSKPTPAEPKPEPVPKPEPEEEPADIADLAEQSDTEMELDELREQAKQAFTDLKDLDKKKAAVAFVKDNGGKITELDLQACYQLLEMLS